MNCMKKEKSDMISIKKSHIFYIFVIILIFLVGLFIGNLGFFTQTGSEATENCRKFCEFIPNTEFSHLGSDNRCYCVQIDRLFDSRLNKTMVYTKIVDAGMITDVEIEQG